MTTLGTDSVPARPSAVAAGPPSRRLNIVRLLTSSGGRRYAGAVFTAAIGGGIVKPFLLLYAIIVNGLTVGAAGLALSAGFLTGLAFVPLLGRWVDHGARTAPMVLTLSLRIVGLTVLLSGQGLVGFVLACLVLGTSDQLSPIAAAAMISRMARARDRDATLAAMRSLSNAGLGAGALLATVCVAVGSGALRGLAVVAGLCYLGAAIAVATMPKPPAPDSPAAASAPRGRRTAEADRPAMRRLAVLNIANLPFAFCFDVLEVALPGVLVTRLQVSPAWSSGIFIVNTALVIALQLPVVLWLIRLPRRTAFAAAGLLLAGSYVAFWIAGSLGGSAGAVGIAVVAIAYTVGEITYTGVNTALVVDTAPSHLLGRALSRWQLSAGIGRALAPLTLTFLLTVSPGLLWGTLAVATCAGAWTVHRYGPLDSDRRSESADGHDQAVGRQPGPPDL